METRGHDEEERGREQAPYEDGGVRLSGTRNPSSGPGSISDAANTRVVYPLIIEQHQQLSPSSHHLVGLEVWGRGHQVTPSSSLDSSAAEGLCSAVTV